MDESSLFRVSAVHLLAQEWYDLLAIAVDSDILERLSQVIIAAPHD
jgi:hypothetical protein